jgi:chorismate synthase
LYRGYRRTWIALEEFEGNMVGEGIVQGGVVSIVSRRKPSGQGSPRTDRKRTSVDDIMALMAIHVPKEAEIGGGTAVAATTMTSIGEKKDRKRYGATHINDVYHTHCHDVE